MNRVIDEVDAASPYQNQPITTTKIADVRWLLNACEDLRMEWLPHLPSPTEIAACYLCRRRGVPMTWYTPLSPPAPSRAHCRRKAC